VTRTPGELADALAALPVSVSSIEISSHEVPVGDYPGGLRPTSVVRVSGAGHSGLGENVAFTRVEHDRFAARADDLLGDLRARGAGSAVGARVDALLPFDPPLYERAALEAALIDLAMQQAGLSLSDLTGTREAPLRFVVSFAASNDPSGHIRRLRASGYTGDLKVDVDPSWDEGTRGALAEEPALAILDFKRRGDSALADGWARLRPDVLLEDPPQGTVSARVARDASIVDARAVAVALASGASVNLKAPRMGGPLEVLRSLDVVARATKQTGDVAGAGETRASSNRNRVFAYLGGMFEVGAGRDQARQMAALYCPDSPNDLAPVTGSVIKGFGRHPLLIRLDTPGFGNHA
jgi:hypothetical protein